MTTPPQPRPDLEAWKRRQALRSSSAAQPIRSSKVYTRKIKHKGRSSQHEDRPLCITARDRGKALFTPPA